MKRTCFYSAESDGQTPGGFAASAAWEESLVADFVLGAMKWCEVAQLLQIPVILAAGCHGNRLHPVRVLLHCVSVS